MTSWPEFFGYLVLVLLGFLWGRASKNFWHDLEIEWWQRWSARQNATIRGLQRRQPHITILPGVEPDDPDSTPWHKIGV